MLAHKSSDAYLQLASASSGLTLRVDVALRDLDVALDLDADGDGRLTWGEVKAAWPAIEAYVAQNVRVAGCPLRPRGRGLERRSDGTYAVLLLESDCRPSRAARIHYALMRGIDATHRGIARIDLAGMPPSVRVLDPAQADARPPAAAQATTFDRFE